jgi:hypothetical protein
MRHTTYTKISKNKLHNLLTKRKLPLNTIEQIKEQVALRKKQIQKARVETRVRYKRWADLIKPLTKEINIVKASIHYHAKTNPQTHLFYQDYLKTLLNTRVLLTKHKLKREATPINTARDKRNWTDWVDKLDKEELIRSYNALPHNYKAKRKAIFPQPKERPVSQTVGNSPTQQREETQ